MVDRRNAPRGPIGRDALATLIERGLSVREIAKVVDRSPTTVRHWLRRYGLQTLRRGPTRGAANGHPTARRLCRRHGVLDFVNEGNRRFRCPKCRAEQVAARRRRVKTILVAEAGGCCAICGYDRYVGALQFHHVDPAEKRFHLGVSGLTRSIAAMRAEAAKCRLLCANCHAEVEGGITPLV